MESSSGARGGARGAPASAAGALLDDKAAGRPTSPPPFARPLSLRLQDYAELGRKLGVPALSLASAIHPLYPSA